MNGARSIGASPLIALHRGHRLEVIKRGLIGLVALGTTLLASAPCLLDARGYELDLLAAASQPFLVVLLAMFAGLVFARSAYSLSLAPAIVVLLFGQTPLGEQSLSTLKSLDFTGASHSSGSAEAQVPLRLITFNAGGGVNTIRATAWLVAQRPDALVIVQGERALLQHPRVISYFEDSAGRASLFAKSKLDMRPFASPSDETETVKRLAKQFPVQILTTNGSDSLLLLPLGPRSPRSEDLWATGVRALSDAALQVRLAQQSTGLPIVVAGDFNSTPNSLGYQRFREISGLRDANNSWWPAGTWPTVLPRWLGIRIDHVFVSEDVTVNSYRLGPNLGGDHRPVVVDLSVPRPSD